MGLFFLILVFVCILLYIFFKIKFHKNIEKFTQMDDNYQLGCSYSQGNGVKKNYDKAIQLLDLSYKQGNEKAKDIIKQIQNKKIQETQQSRQSNISIESPISSKEKQQKEKCTKDLHYFKGRQIVWENLKLNGNNINNYVWTNEKMILTGNCKIYSSNYQSFDNEKFQILIGLEDDYPTEIYNNQTKAFTINTSKCFKNTDCSNLGINNTDIGNQNTKWSCDKGICKLNCKTNTDCYSGGLTNNFKCVNNKCLKSCRNNSQCSQSNDIGGNECISFSNGKYCSVNSNGIVNFDNQISTDNPYYIIEKSNGIKPFNNKKKCNQIASVYPIISLQHNDFDSKLIVPPGNWINSAKEIRVNKINNNENRLTAKLENNKNKSSTNYKSGIIQQSYSNNNGNFIPDVNINIQKKCHRGKKKFGIFKGKRKCKNIVTRTPIMIQQENPQTIWNNQKCNIQNNKVYEFDFNVEFYPKNYQYGIIPIYIGYALTDYDKTLFKNKNHYQKFGSTINKNHYLINNSNVHVLTNINIKQKYKYVQDGYTKCSSVCHSGTKEMIFKCKNIKNNNLEYNNSYCSGLPFNSKIINCNLKNCNYQPNIQNVICYISTINDENTTYKNTENYRMGIRNFQKFDNNQKLQENPYYNYTRTFISSAKHLDVEWVIITTQTYSNNHIQKCYIYNPKYKSYLSFDTKIGITTTNKKFLDDDCLWELKAEPINKPIYYIKHINTQKYLYSTNKIKDYLEINTFQKQIKNNTNNIENIKYNNFGQLYCDDTKKNKWFIVPIEPINIEKKSYQNVEKVCKQKNMKLASKQELYPFTQIGGLDKQMYWTSNIFSDYYDTQQLYNSCITKCKKVCNKDCLQLPHKLNVDCLIDCDKNNCPNKCEYLSKNNTNTNKTWHKSQIIDNQSKNLNQSWLTNFDDGYYSIGNHKKGIYPGLCIQKQHNYK